MRPLRLALIRQRYAEDGGAERFLARAVHALRAQGVSVTLIAREWQGGSGYETLRCNPFHLGRLWRDWSFARCVCRLLKAQRFDLVQSHERLACCDLYRAGDGVHREWLAIRARALPAWRRWLQALNPYHIYVKHAEQRLFASPRLKAVICNSHMVKEEIRRWFGVPEEKLHVIYNGVDTEHYHPRLKQERAAVRARYGIPEEATLLLFVGSGFERKGIGGLLEAMAGLPTDVYLLIVGRDRKQPRYAARARALGLGARVRFLGVQPDVRPFYGAADALVLPTLYDPFPNVALEAMACGLPVVTSTKSGVAELIENGRNGFVCDAFDRTGLLAALQALRQAERRAAMGQAARARVEALSLEEMGTRLLALYQELLAAPQHPESAQAG